MPHLHLQPQSDGDSLHRFLTQIDTCTIWGVLICIPASWTYSAVRIFHVADWWPALLINVALALCAPVVFSTLNRRRSRSVAL